MDWWNGLLAGWEAFWADPQAVKDVGLPSASIVVSALIAVSVLGTQLAVQARGARTAAIAALSAAIARVSAEGTKLQESRPNGIEAAMEAMDAAATALRLVLPRRQRAVPHFVRDEIYTAYMDPDPWALLARCDATDALFEDWAEGYIPSREFRAVLRRNGGRSHFRDLSAIWERLIEEAEGPPMTPSEAEIAEWRASREYKRMKRLASRHRFAKF